MTANLELSERGHQDESQGKQLRLMPPSSHRDGANPNCPGNQIRKLSADWRAMRTMILIAPDSSRWPQHAP